MTTSGLVDEMRAMAGNGQEAGVTDAGVSPISADDGKEWIPGLRVPLTQRSVNGKVAFVRLPAVAARNSHKKTASPIFRYCGNFPKPS